MITMDPIRIVLLVVVICLFPAGFVTGCVNEKGRHDQTKAAVRATAQIQEQRAKEQQERDNRAKLETEANHAKAIEIHRRKFSSLYTRYAQLLDAPSGSSIVSGSSSGAAELVPAGRVCFDAQELERGVQQALGRFALGALGGLQSGEEGLDDRRWWGDFARRIESCPALSPGK